MLRPAHILQIAVVALLGIAVVFVHSAGMAVRPPAPEAAAAASGGVAAGFAPDAGFFDALFAMLGPLLSRNTIYAVLAVIAMVMASRINVRQLFRARGVSNPLFLIVAASLALVALTFVPGIGKNVNCASRWIYIGPKSMGLSFQPSELVKWVMVLAVAWWCSRRRGVMHRPLHGLLPPVLLIAVACGMVLIEDLGTGALIGMVALCMLIAGGARLWQLGLAIPPAACALGAAIYHSPYRVARIMAFLNPWDDPQGIGYHPIQSMVAIAQGGLTGRGLGNGIQKFGYLPEDTTDFIFAIICEEMGLAGAILVMSLYLVIIWVGLGIVRDCKDTFGRLVGLGVILTVGFQAVINIAVVTVVVPTKGIALPLISAGGTGWMVTAFALGLVAALDNANYLDAVEAEQDLVPAELDPAEDDDAPGSSPVLA